MELSPQVLAIAFSQHRFSEVYPAMAAGIRWKLNGAEVLVGRDSVMARCEQSAEYLAQVETEFIEFSATGIDTSVVIESVARYSADKQTPSQVASCDLYRFEASQLVEISSYTIEIGQP